MARRPPIERIAHELAEIKALLAIIARPEGPFSAAAQQTLTIHEVARQIGVSAATVYRWRNRHNFPKPLPSVGGPVRYFAEDIARWNAARLRLKEPAD